jgi:16S rRNA G966 N2-methylase RsmD
VWNSLSGRLEVSRIADIFSGSGAVGLEGVSRGAQMCYFVESSAAACKCLDANILEAKRRALKQDIDVELRLFQGDASAWLESVGSRLSFDLVWLDPPYAMVESFLKEYVIKLFDLVAEGGILVVESSSESAKAVENIVKDYHDKVKIKQKRYGASTVTQVSIGS